MRRQLVAPDGSCLFTAIDYLIHGTFRPQCAPELRELCATQILLNSALYDEVYLGMAPGSYAEWITNPHNYGGEIEIVILANHFRVSIAVVSMESLSILPYSPTSMDGTEALPTIYIIYNGQHYDALVASDTNERIFDANVIAIRNAEAIALATTEKQQRDQLLRTRIRKKFQCECGVILEDAEAFQTHCETVEHDEDFGYQCTEIEVKEMVQNVNDD